MGTLGAILGALGGVLGASWDALGRILEPSWEIFGPQKGLGKHLRSVLAALCSHFEGTHYVPKKCFCVFLHFANYKLFPAI